MISLDYSVVYQVVLFLVVWVILSKVLFRPYVSLLEERERKTTGAEHDLSELEHEAARLRAQYEEKIAQAQAAGNGAKEAILQDARQQREGVLTQAREEAMSILEGVRRELANQMQKERQLAAAEVRAIAQEMATKVLGRNVG
ncbi:MAG TPA: ATP synthase F0 subunit B [Candidatus Binatia bacterium]|nr:ATP synthase F0 subunit B [Candidatus Binatia bacterium]